MSSLFSIQAMAMYIGWSFAVTAILMIAEVFMLKRRRQQILKRIGRVSRRSRKQHDNDLSN